MLLICDGGNDDDDDDTETKPKIIRYEFSSVANLACCA